MPAIATLFAGAETGLWRIVERRTLCGEPLPAAAALRIGEAGSAWSLRGVASHLRYTAARERRDLTAVQAALGRPVATRAALIPIRKSADWWALAQDERLRIYRRSGHYAIGHDYARTVARKLFHARDLGEPFDFLTWFEFDPADEADFDALLRRLRESEEWRFVDREVELRLAR